MNKIELVPTERQKILKNPDLILLDKEVLLALLKDMDFPDQENLIDIRNAFIKKLGEKLELLRATNSKIIKHAYENQLGIKKVHQCCLEIIKTKEIRALFEFLCLKAAEILRVDNIKIVICKSIITDFNHKNFSFKTEEKITKFVKSVGITNLKTVRLRDTLDDKKREDFEMINRGEDIKSEAIMGILVNNRFKCVVFFESLDRSTFSIDQSTDYLEFFNQIITKHLESLLNQ